MGKQNDWELRTKGKMTWQKQCSFPWSSIIYEVKTLYTNISSGSRDHRVWAAPLIIFHGIPSLHIFFVYSSVHFSCPLFILDVGADFLVRRVDIAWSERWPSGQARRLLILRKCSRRSRYSREKGSLKAQRRNLLQKI